jgi:acetyl-CoA carboxylase carboxyl transferase subunit alpha
MEKKMHTRLTSWQIVQIARHRERPLAIDYIQRITEGFFELHGDRVFSDDHSIVAGLATIGAFDVMLIAQQKGRDTKEKHFHNYGMPHPEGYRKIYRLMEHAEKFALPVICLIDTPGAFPGLEDEERGQSEAIAANLYLMSHLRVPIISVVIGEGCSGGALGMGIADRLLMLEYSFYTVAAPEAAASILWRNSGFAPEAAEAMKISAHELMDANIVDDIVAEPLGGAHEDHVGAAKFLHHALVKHLDELCHMPLNELLTLRDHKYRSIGAFHCSEASPVGLQSVR